MTGAHRWWARIALAAVVYGVVLTVGTALDDDPDPVVVAGVVAVLVAAGSLVLDATQLPRLGWTVRPASAPGLGRRDPRTASYLRLLEGHLTAADVGPALRDRLRELTDRVLRDRHDLGLEDPRADAILGPELAAALRQPPRRLTVPAMQRLVERIESL